MKEGRQGARSGLLLCLVEFVSFSSFLEPSFTYRTIHPLRGYHSWVLRIFTDVGNHRHRQFWNILIAPKRSPVPISITSTPWPPRAHSLSVDLPVLDVSRQWDHTPCVLLCLLLSLSVVCLGPSPCSRVRASLFFTAASYSSVWVDTCVCPLTHGWILGLCPPNACLELCCWVRGRASVGVELRP